MMCFLLLSFFGIPFRFRPIIDQCGQLALELFDILYMYVAAAALQHFLSLFLSYIFVYRQTFQSYHAPTHNPFHLNPTAGRTKRDERGRRKQNDINKEPTIHLINTTRSSHPIGHLYTTQGNTIDDRQYELTVITKQKKIIQQRKTPRERERDRREVRHLNDCRQLNTTPVPFFI